MFNIRVYGVWIHDNKLLLCKEHVKGMQVIKFPGGGLEYGEGTIDCLKREFKEELQLDIVVKKHFYTTDFFVKSAFNTQEQIMSVYYLIDAEWQNVSVPKELNIEFFWIDILALTDETATLIIDKHVIQLIKAL